MDGSLAIYVVLVGCFEFLQTYFNTGQSVPDIKNSIEDFFSVGFVFRMGL